MKFKKNANVFTGDGEKVGEINRVVLDPEDREVTHVVVQQGFLFTQDKILPVDLIEEATEERVTLNVESEELEDLPDFRRTRFVPVHEAGPTGPDQADAVPSYYWRSPTNVTWEGGAEEAVGAGAAFVPAEERRVPEGTVALKKGAMVVSSDGKRMGRVETVITDPEERRATHLVIARGLLLTERKRIPTSWISRVTEEEVHLEVTSETLQDLPEHETAS